MELSDDVEPGARTSLNMLRATLMVASRVPKEGATSGSNAGVVKLRTNRVLYSAKSIH